MPRKFKRSYRRKNRRFRKRRYPIQGRSKKGLMSLTIRRPSLLPDRLFVRLKYTRIAMLTVNAAIGSILTFRGNGAYDPEFNLGGHSPLGYDQWASLYQNYRVHKSTIYYKIASITEACRVCITPTTVAGKPINTIVASEYPYNKMRTFPTSLTQRPTVMNSMYTKKLLGLQSIAYEDGFQAPVNDVPLNQWYWTITISSFNGVTSFTAYADITIVYSMEFFNRTELSQSGTVSQPFGQTGPTGGYGESVGGATGAPGNLYD